MTKSEKKARKLDALKHARTDWATRSGRYNAQRGLYQSGLQYVTYYVWSALRGSAPAGNDPITGRPKSNAFNHPDRELGRAMDTAAARLYLRRASAVRAPMGI